jgi:hypothetical protein
MDIRVPDWCLTLVSCAGNRAIPSVMREQVGNFCSGCDRQRAAASGRLSMGSVTVGGTRTPIGLITTVPAEDSSS